MTHVSKSDRLSLMADLMAMGVSPPYASQIANRRRTPSLELAVKIEDALGIRPRFWVRDDDAVNSAPTETTEATTYPQAATGGDLPAREAIRSKSEGDGEEESDPSTVKVTVPLPINGAEKKAAVAG